MKNDHSEEAKNLGRWAKFTLALAHDSIDRQYVSEGVTIVELIDADIAYLSADPSAADYFTDLLPANNKVEATALGRHLANITFDTPLPSGITRRMAPAHFLEILNQATTPDERAIERQKDAIASLTKASIANLSTWINSSGDAAPEKSVIDDLAILFGFDGRLAPFELQDRLREWCLKHKTWPMPATNQQNSRTDAHTIAWPDWSTAEARETTKWWEKRLVTNPGEPPRGKDTVDARVLTALGILNTNWKRNKRRYHLVTGSMRLHKATISTVWESPDGGNTSPQAKESQKHWWTKRQTEFEFPTEFLRTPWSILALNDLWMPEKGVDGIEVFSLRGVIDRIPKSDRYLDISHKNQPLKLRHLFANAIQPILIQNKQMQLTNDRQLPNWLLEIMKKNASNTLLELTVKSAKLKELRLSITKANGVRIDNAKAQLGLNGSEVNDIKNTLLNKLKTIENSHRMSFQTATLTEYLISLQSNKNTARVRNSPYVDFGTFKATLALREYIISSRSEVVEDSKFDIDQLRRHLNASLKEDDTSYCLILAFASAIAILGQESFAIRAAGYARALSISPNFSHRNHLIKGEEAALLEIALKRQTLQDIGSTLALIKSTEDFYKKNETLLNSTTKLRFEVERSSLEVARLCFNYFPPDSSSLIAKDDLMAESRGSKNLILDDCSVLSVAIAKKVNSDSNAKNITSTLPTELLENLRLRLLTNFFMARLLIWKIDTEINTSKENHWSDVEVDYSAQFLTMYKEYLNKLEVASNKLARAVFLAANAIWQPRSGNQHNRSERQDHFNFLNNLIADAERDNGIATPPYDSRRLTFLRDIFNSVESI